MTIKIEKSRRLCSSILDSLAVGTSILVVALMYNTVQYDTNSDIDPALTIQSRESYDDVDCSYGKSTLRRRIRLFLNDFHFYS